MANRNGSTSGERTEGLIDARTGAAKNTQTNFNSKQSHVAAPGITARNVSSTEAQRILGNDGGLGEVHGGGTPGTYQPGDKAGHRGENVPLHPATTDEQRMKSITDNGNDVLKEAALGLRSSAHLPPDTTEK